MVPNQCVLVAMFMCHVIIGQSNAASTVFSRVTKYRYPSSSSTSGSLSDIACCRTCRDTAGCQAVSFHSYAKACELVTDLNSGVSFAPGANTEWTFYYLPQPEATTTTSDVGSTTPESGTTTPDTGTTTPEMGTTTPDTGTTTPETGTTTPETGTTTPDTGTTTPETGTTTPDTGTTTPKTGTTTQALTSAVPPITTNSETSTTTNGSVGCLSDWDSAGDTCYYVITSMEFGDDAMSACKALHPDATLVEMTSDAERDLIVSLIGKSVEGYVYAVWIGGKTDVAGTYRYESGVAVNDGYNIWAPSYPNSYADGECIIFIVNDLDWHNLPCSNTLFESICAYTMK